MRCHIDARKDAFTVAFLGLSPARNDTAVSIDPRRVERDDRTMVVDARAMVRPATRRKRVQKAMKQAITDVLLLGVLSLGLGFGMNSVRGSKHIEPAKNYFEKAAGKSGGAPAASNANTAAPSTRPSTSNAPTKVEPVASAPVQAATADAPKPTKKLEHPYQEIQLDEVAKVFKDSGTKQGLNIFVDARKEDLFVEGHIPGALHCDPYDATRHIEAVLQRANGVERVIVYCGGGDCEDSIFLCRELIDAGVPEDAVYLFAGGWKDWSAKQLPVETGGHD